MYLAQNVVKTKIVGTLLDTDHATNVSCHSQFYLNSQQIYLSLSICELYVSGGENYFQLSEYFGQGINIIGKLH